MNQLTSDDLVRYARNISIEQIGLEGQAKLKNSSVLVIGCGALGNIASSYICASGIGRLDIADFDTIDISNLQRQIMYSTEDVGESKSATLARRLRALNPDVDIREIPRKILREEATELFAEYDFIVDGSDNSDTKFMTSEICCAIGKPCAIGGVAGFRGQITTWTPGATPYHELFRISDNQDTKHPAPVGVLGPLPGIIGAIQATEAIKHILGVGSDLSGKLLNIDLLKMEFNIFKF